MTAATRNFILIFLVLCAVGVGITFIPAPHAPVPATDTATPEAAAH